MVLDSVVLLCAVVDDSVVAVMDVVVDVSEVEVKVVVLDLDVVDDALTRLVEILAYQGLNKAPPKRLVDQPRRKG